VIGTPPDPLADYLLRIEDVTNGRILILPVSNDGLTMSVDVSDFTFANNHSYEVVLVSTTSPSEPIAWQVDSTEVTCLQVEFYRMYDANREVYFLDTQTIVL
jgi:hypothetical protein